MAFYENKTSRESGIHSFAPEQNARIAPPEKIDEMLLEALEALAQVRKLHESTANPETKRQAKCILENLHSSLLKLAPLGIHSVSRLQNLPARA